MKPLARQDQLTVRELPQETLVYDGRRHVAHCLNRTTALVWKHCDGGHDVASLAALLAGRLGGITPDQADAAVRLALEQLGRRGLLQEAVPPPGAQDRVARREALRVMARVAAAALPLVMTLRSPSIAWALSSQKCNPSNGGSDCPTQVCQTASCPTQPSGPHTSNTSQGVCVYVNAADGTACPGGTCKNGQCVADPPPAPVRAPAPLL
jgi:hypothetical protein